MKNINKYLKVIVFCLLTGLLISACPIENESNILPAPSGMRIETWTSNSVSLSWSLVAGASRYGIYRNTSQTGEYRKVGESLVGSYTDNSGLSPETTYWYRLSAYNANGDESVLSAPASITTNPTIRPSVPSDVTAYSASSSSIIISWSSVSDASGYYVYRSTSSSGTYSRVGDVQGYTSYTNTGLSGNTTYYYKVSAYNSDGESAQSSYAYATTSSSSSSSAIDLTNGTYYSNTLTAGATHLYRFYGTSGAIYYIEWDDHDNSSYSGDIKAGLRREGYTSLAVEMSDSSSGFSYTPTTSDYYIIVVTGYSASSSGTYRVRYRTTSTATTGAIDLTSGYWSNNTMTAGATHLYRFYGYSGTTYNIKWDDHDNSSYTGDIKVGLRREGYTTLAVAMSDSTSGFTYTPTTSDYYIVVVTGYSASSSGTYRVGYY